MAIYPLHDVRGTTKIKELQKSFDTKLVFVQNVRSVVVVVPFSTCESDTEIVYAQRDERTTQRELRT